MPNKILNSGVFPALHTRIWVLNMSVVFQFPPLLHLEYFLIGWTVSKHLLGAPMQVLCILSQLFHGMGPLPPKPALKMVQQEASSKQNTNMPGGIVVAPPSHVMFLSVAFTKVIFYSPCFRKENRSVSICLNHFISLGFCVLFWHVFWPYFQFPER